MGEGWGMVSPRQVGGLQTAQQAFFRILGAIMEISWFPDTGKLATQARGCGLSTKKPFNCFQGFTSGCVKKKRFVILAPQEFGKIATSLQNAVRHCLVIATYSMVIGCFYAWFTLLELITWQTPTEIAVLKPTLTYTLAPDAHHKTSNQSQEFPSSLVFSRRYSVQYSKI